MLRIDKVRRIPRTNLYLVGFAVLLGLSSVLFRIAYVESFRLFAKGYVSSYVSAAGKFRSVLADLDGTGYFLDRLLSDPGSAAGAFTCALAWQEDSQSLWIARHILRVDLCAEIAGPVAHWGASADVEIEIMQKNLVIAVPLGDQMHKIKRPVSEVLNQWRLNSRALLRIFAILLGSVLLTGLAVWWFLIRRMLLLIRNIERSLETAQSKDQFWLLPRENRTQDEIGKLENSIRKAIRATVASNRRLQNDRRNVYHDIRNRLQALMTINEANQDALKHLSRIEAAMDIEPEEDERDLEIMDVNEFVRSWVDMLKKQGFEQSIIFSGVERCCTIRVNPGALEDALDPIRNNAADFRFSGTDIEVGVACYPPCATITVRNQGPHIKEEHLKEIFKPGISTRLDEDNHLGRGLARARELVERMDGEISARNVPGGVEFIIELPLDDA